MKDFSQYIFEKLKINKDTEIEQNLLDLYSVGDRCLLLTYISKGKSSHPSFVLVDAVKIKKILKESFECEYLTHFSTAKEEEKIFFKYTYSQEKDYKFLRSYSRPGLRPIVLIPEKECDKLLEYIEYKKYISFYGLLRNTYSNHPLYENIIVKVKSSPIIWKNVTGISIGEINKLKEKLKER